MHSGVEAIPSVQVDRHRSSGLPLAKALTRDLPAAGFRAQLGEEPFGPQAGGGLGVAGLHDAGGRQSASSRCGPPSAPGQTLVWRGRMSTHITHPHTHFQPEPARMSFSSNSIAPGAMRGATPPHRLAASPSQTAVAAQKVGSRACANQADAQAAASVQTPKSTFPRINPLNPEPAAAPAPNPKSPFPRINPLNPEPTTAPPQNPKSAFSRINPLNPEPAPPPAQNPKSALSRINPVNPEPAVPPAQNPNSPFSRIDPLNPEPAVPPVPIASSCIDRPTPRPPGPRRVTCAAATSGQVRTFTRLPWGPTAAWFPPARRFCIPART